MADIGTFNLQFFAASDSLPQVQQLREMFPLRTVLAYVRMQRPINYIGGLLFPEETITTLDFEYFKDSNVLPVMAHVQNFGAESEIASREGLSKVIGEMAAIKRKVNLDERYIIALWREGYGDLDFVSNKIFSDLDNLTASVFCRKEAMAIEVLTTGKLTLAENGVVQTIDYLMPSDHKETLENTHLWSAASTATPIDDIQEWVQKIEDDTGFRPTRALTSNTVVANLMKSVQIREMIYGESGSTRAININDINSLLTVMNLPRISEYNQQYRTQSEAGAYSSSRFMASSFFVLLPEEAPGKMLVGPTAEALLSKVGLSPREISGLWATVDVLDSNDPPAVWTKVATTAIPTFQNVDKVFVANVI